MSSSTKRVMPAEGWASDFGAGEVNGVEPAEPPAGAALGSLVSFVAIVQFVPDH
jgi:hypothetical protein